MMILEDMADQTESHVPGQVEPYIKYWSGIVPKVGLRQPWPLSLLLTRYGPVTEGTIYTVAVGKREIYLDLNQKLFHAG